MWLKKVELPKNLCQSIHRNPVFGRLVPNLRWDCSHKYVTRSGIYQLEPDSWNSFKLYLRQAQDSQINARAPLLINIPGVPKWRTSVAEKQIFRHSSALHPPSQHRRGSFSGHDCENRQKDNLWQTWCYVMPVLSRDLGLSRSHHSLHKVLVVTLAWRC